MKISLIVISLLAMIPAIGQVSVHFDLNTKSSEFEIKTFRFYISNIAAEYSNGEILREENSYHLVDLQAAESHLIELDIPKEGIAWIQFMIGIDSTTNVSGILDGDLDPINGMYWAWNTGYINFKIEGKHREKDFEYHVGGYLPPYQTVQEKRLKCEGNEINVSFDMESFMIGAGADRPASVLIPGPEAVQLAEEFQNFFTISRDE